MTRWAHQFATKGRNVAGPAHRARRRFGQNFLVDRSYINRVIDALAPMAGDRVVEIGPGLGALTAPLLERVATLHVIEIDRDLVARLAAEFPPERLIVHQEDALNFDLSSLGSEVRLIGNLPYNISSPLLFHAVRHIRTLKDCHFMLQAEVVHRMAAAPGTKTYGRLSVMLQYWFSIEKLFGVPASAFRPMPKVDSAFARLTPRRPKPVVAQDEELFAALVARAFTKRRKTLRNAMAQDIAAQDFTALGIDPQLRPEAVSVEDFVRLANAVTARGRSAA